MCTCENKIIKKLNELNTCQISYPPPTNILKSFFFFSTYRYFLKVKFTGMRCENNFRKIKNSMGIVEVFCGIIIIDNVI